MRRILLAVDGSENSLRAADLAGQLSAMSDVPVDIVYVLERGTPRMPKEVEEKHLAHVTPTKLDLEKAAGRDIVSAATSRVSKAGGTVEGQQVRIGPPAHEIVDAAEDLDCDCIVMGRRGLGDVRGLLMGSVSTRVGQLSDRTLVTTR